MENKKKRIIISALISLIIFVALTIAVIQQNSTMNSIDLSIQQKVSTIRTSSGISFFQTLTTILNPETLIAILALMGFYFYYKKKNKLAGFLILGAGLSFIIKELLSLLIQRTRPIPYFIDAISFSFPSGHAIGATVFFLILFFILRPKIKSKLSRTLILMISIIIFLLASFARIYLNVHWFSDVLASIFLGTFVICLSWLIVTRNKYSSLN
ncbi:MAG: phosphatase PAP2 family protein [Nanoarchaeota archaeon]